jgi:hypothetical protein
LSNGSGLISVDKPGKQVDLPISITKELERIWYNNRRRLPFFGGHPVSVTRQSCNEIFASLNADKLSPYLVCEKTDGVRYLLIVTKVNYSELNREVIPGEESPYTEFYLVSRQGQGKLIAYAVDIGISH